MPDLVRVVVAATGTLARVHGRLARGAAKGRSTELRASQSRTQFRREGLAVAAFSHGREVLTAAVSLVVTWVHRRRAVARVLSRRTGAEEE